MLSPELVAPLYTRLLQRKPLDHHGLIAKRVLPPVAIVPGTLAFKRSSTRADKGRCFIAALAVVGFMASVAVAHHPRSPFAA